jgi:hypothetical protein
MLRFDFSPGKESLILVMQYLKCFKIAYEVDSLMSCHIFYDVADTNYDLKMTCLIFVDVD